MFINSLIVLRSLFAVDRMLKSNYSLLTGYGLNDFFAENVHTLQMIIIISLIKTSVPFNLCCALMVKYCNVSYIFRYCSCRFGVQMPSFGLQRWSSNQRRVQFFFPPVYKHCFRRYRIKKILLSTLAVFGSVAVHVWSPHTTPRNIFKLCIISFLTASVVIFRAKHNTDPLETPAVITKHTEV